MTTDHPSNRKKVLLHHLLGHMHLTTRVSTMIRIPKITLRKHRVVWREGVVSLLPAPGVVEMTLEFIVRGLHWLFQVQSDRAFHDRVFKEQAKKW